MKNSCWIFIVLLSLVSCGELSDRARLQKIVEEWQGKQIDLPNGMTDFITGDTIDLSSVDFIILNYVDSTGCTGCKMKLALWREFLCSLDTLTDVPVATLFIVDTPDTRELSFLINRDNYSNPVYLDTKHHIVKHCTFPNNPDFHTLLLDRARKVLAIGSPVSDNGIAQLYKSIVSGQSTLSNNFDGIVKVNRRDINLGELSVGQEIITSFTLSNLGNDTVHIKEVISSCPCTQVSLQTGIILPKSTIKGIITYLEDSSPGFIETNITIFYDKFDYPSVIRLRGNVN